MSEDEAGRITIEALRAVGFAPFRGNARNYVFLRWEAEHSDLICQYSPMKDTFLFHHKNKVGAYDTASYPIFPISMSQVVAMQELMRPK